MEHAAEKMVGLEAPLLGSTLDLGSTLEVDNMLGLDNTVGAHSSFVEGRDGDAFSGQINQHR